jgi:hypothetical protein
MEERFQELAMLKLAGRASAEESSELEKLLSENESFRAEYDQLEKEIPAIKDLIPMVKSPETSDEEVPTYERTAFLTDVGEIFGKLKDAKGAAKDSEESVPLLDSQMAGARFMPDTGADNYAAAPDKNDGSGFSFFKLALAGLAVCALVILINMPDKNIDPIAKAPEPVIQLAMLDIVGETRGEGNETVKSFKDAWPQAAYENYSEMDPAREWREQWDDDSKTPQVKILYDVTEAEVTVLGKWKGEAKTETLPVDDNLAEVIQKAKELVRQWYPNK